MNEATMHIGSVPIYGDLILAPMAGYSDPPFRALCRVMGSSLSYMPCIRDDGIVQASRRTQALLAFAEEERPVALQLLSKDEERLVAALSDVLPLRPDIIDINMGCPARRVSGGGRGSALLREPDRVGQLARRLVDASPVPVTAKIRLGWDSSSLNYLEVASILEQSGVAAIAVHGRTKEQGYSGRADWDAIAAVKRAVSVPVIANGDVRTVADIGAIRDRTGCDAVMIGRGALGNPWIFARRDNSQVPYIERLPVIRQHLQSMLTFYGDRVGLLLFRKHVVRYVQGLVGAPEFRPRLVAAETAHELLSLLEGWNPVLAQQEPDPFTAENTQEEQCCCEGGADD